MAGTKFIEPDSFDPTLWREFIDLLSPTTDSLTPNSGTFRITGYVPWEWSYSFQLKAIGYHYTDQDNNLRRVNPLLHPFYNWAWCVAMPDGRGAEPDFVNLKEVYNVPGALPALANYKTYRATIEFQIIPPTMQVLSDDIVDQLGRGEWERYVTMTTEPNNEVLKVDTGQIIFDAAGEPDIANNIVQAATYLPTIKSNIIITWHNVPIDYVYDGFNFAQFPKAFNKINATEIWGFPAGTLLCSSNVKPTYKPAPLRIGDEDPRYCYVDLTMVMIHTDPTNALAGSTVRGHNLAPAPYGSANVGKYYPIKYNRTGSTGVFESYEFRNLFRHWSA